MISNGNNGDKHLECQWPWVSGEMCPLISSLFNTLIKLIVSVVLFLILGSCDSSQSYLSQEISRQFQATGRTLGLAQQRYTYGHRNSSRVRKVLRVLVQKCAVSAGGVNGVRIAQTVRALMHGSKEPHGKAEGGGTSPSPSGKTGLLTA